MNKVAILIIITVLGFDTSAGITSWKGKVHMAVLPFIEGTGIYTSVRVLQTTDQAANKAAAITNLSLLGVQGTLGSIILFGPKDLPPAVRLVHRIVGTAILATGLWQSIGATVDDDVPNAAQATAYCQVAFTAVPLVLFTF